MMDDDGFIQIFNGKRSSYGYDQTDVKCGCGNNEFKLTYTDRYQLTAICAKCFVSEVVCDG